MRLRFPESALLRKERVVLLRLARHQVEIAPSADDVDSDKPACLGLPASGACSSMPSRTTRYELKRDTREETHSVDELLHR
jgi:hypothetical protein